MLLGFTVLLLVIGAGIVASMYSFFLPFFNQLSDISSYNIAYYSATAGIERGLLATRYQQPGFVGSGGQQGTSIFRGPAADAVTTGLGRIHQGNNNLWRSIDARTTAIPASGAGNIPFVLRSADSTQYNMLDYDNILTALLYYDNTTNSNDYYTNDGQLVQYNGTQVAADLRLPPYVYEAFGNTTTALLCDSIIDVCDYNNDNLHNDIVATWTVKGTYTPTNMDFTIIPVQDVYFGSNPALVNEGTDTSIRESVINNESDISTNILFGNTYTPINTISSSLTAHTVIASDTSVIASQTFQQLFANTSITGLTISLSLVDMLRSRNNYIYPFLSYKMIFDSPVADTHYRIVGASRINDYDVRISIDKPTTNQQAAGEFTVIF